VSFAPAAATAQIEEKAAEKCEKGHLISKTITGNVVVKGVSCTIVDSVISGKLTVTNSPRFMMNESRVDGKVKITGSNEDTEDAWILDNIFGSSLDVQKIGGKTAIYHNDIVGNGSIILKKNADLIVVKNTVATGNLTCKKNDAVFASQNIVTNGTDGCRSSDF